MLFRSGFGVEWILTITYQDSKRISGLSTDTKPTNVPSGNTFVYTDNGKRKWYDGSSWLPIDPATRGLFATGLKPSGTFISSIDYITIATTGNATNFGNLSSVRYGGSSTTSYTRGCFAGGDNTAGTRQSVIDYVTIATTGNSTNFGNLTVARNQQGSGVTNLTRGVFGGTGSATTGNIADYITIATTGNATSFGTLTVNVTDRMGGVTDFTKGCFAGGDLYPNNYTSVIDYITIATTGNATNFGNLTSIRGFGDGVSNTTRGCFIGSNTSILSVIDYITIATTGNATSFGNLTQARYGVAGGVNSDVRGVFAGGNSGGYQNTMDYITIMTTGNATSFGQLNNTVFIPSGCSGS